MRSLEFVVPVICMRGWMTILFEFREKTCLRGLPTPHGEFAPAAGLMGETVEAKDMGEM